MSHKTTIEAVCDYIRLQGGKCWKTSQVGRLYGSAGIPDVIAAICIPDRLIKMNPVRWQMLFVEVKVGEDKLSPAQQGFRDIAELCGVPVIVGGLDDVLPYVENLKHP